MEFSEFKKAFAEMRDYYGDKNFPPKVESTIFRIVEPLNRGEFKQVCEALIEEQMKAPSPAMIKRAALPLLRNAEKRKFEEQIRQLEAQGKKCKACDHGGIIYAYLKTNPVAEYSFRCPHCVAAKIRRLSFKIPEWSRELREKYEPIFFNLDSVKAADDAKEKFRGDLVREIARLKAQRVAVVKLRDETAKMLGLAESHLLEEQVQLNDLPF